jgi:polysaccharide biosynthesis transport protein
MPKLDKDEVRRRCSRDIATVEEPTMKSKIIFGKAVLILGFVLCGVGIWFLLTPPSYRASVRVEVDHKSAPGVYDPWFIQTEFEVIESPIILDKVIKRVNLLTRADGKTVGANDAMRLLQRRMSLRPVKGDTLEISVIDERPEQAARIANAIAETYRDFVAEQRHRELGLDDTGVRIVAPAVPPKSPIFPNRVLGIGLLLCGLATTAAGTFLISNIGA